MKIKLKNARPQAKRGRRVGDEDDLLAYLMNRNQSIYSPNGGYQVNFAPTAENRDYQAVGLPAAQIVGQSPNPQARYVNQLANQVSQQQGVGNNNDYFRTVGILNNIVKDKQYVGEDGALNQQGWAKLAQDQMFGPGSDWYKRHSQSAKDIASGLAQVAMLPYAAGMTVPNLLASTVGGVAGGTVGSNIGKRFNNPYTGNYSGSEIGNLVGGGLGSLFGVPLMGMPIRQIPGRGMLGSLKGHMGDVGRRLIGRPAKNQPSVVSTADGKVLVDNYDPFSVNANVEAEAAIPENLGKNSIKNAEQYNATFGNTDPTTLTPKQVMEYNNAIGHKGRLNPKRVFGFDGRKTPIHLLFRWYRKNPLISKIMDGSSTSRMSANDLFKAIKQGNKGLNKGYGTQLMEDATNAARKELATRIVKANPESVNAINSVASETSPMQDFITGAAKFADEFGKVASLQDITNITAPDWQPSLALPARPSVINAPGRTSSFVGESYSPNYRIYNPDGNNRAIRGTSWREFVDPNTGEVRRINYKNGGTIRRRLESGGKLSY